MVFCRLAIADAGEQTRYIVPSPHIFRLRGGLIVALFSFKFFRTEIILLGRNQITAAYQPFYRRVLA